MNKQVINLFLTKRKIFIDKQYFSLLTLLESKKIFSIENNCREGFCGVCRTNIIKGKVNYIIKPIAYIQKNEILPCCCKAKESITLNL